MNAAAKTKAISDYESGAMQTQLNLTNASFKSMPGFKDDWLVFWQSVDPTPGSNYTETGGTLGGDTP